MMHHRYTAIKIQRDIIGRLLMIWIYLIYVYIYVYIWREGGREKREKEEKERLCTANINTAFEKIGTNMHTNYTEG